MRYTLYMKIRSAIYALLLVILLPGILSPVRASDDHMEARRLREAGEVLPLQSLLDTVREQYPGTVIEVELEREHGRVIYEIEILDDDGRVREIRIDARSGELLSAEEDD